MEKASADNSRRLPFLRFQLETGRRPRRARPRPSCRRKHTQPHSTVRPAGSPSLSVTFTAKRCCLQVNTVGLQPHTWPSSHGSLVGNKCEHCLMSPVCGPWREAAMSTITFILQGRRERQSKRLTLPLSPAFWTFPSGYPAGLSNLTYLKLNAFFLFPKYIPPSGHSFLVNGATVHTGPLVESSESNLISLILHIQ